MLRLNFSDLLRDFQWRAYMCVCVCVFMHVAMYVYMYVHTRDWISHDKLICCLQLEQTMTDVSVGITLPISAEKKGPPRDVLLLRRFFYQAIFPELCNFTVCIFYETVISERPSRVKM